MSGIPQTRASLLLRIKDPADRDAWEEFVQLYRPIIYRMARKRGLQDADAQDLAQRVLGSVASSVEGWEHDPRRARFSTWLTTVTRNAIIDSVRRIKLDKSPGGTSMLNQIQRLPQSEEAASAEIEREYRRQLFRRAATEVQHEFESTTWDAFWLTTVEGVSVVAAAERIGKAIGSVYAARSRVMRRLKEKVSQLEVTDE
ncbi:MAG: RNA polymerase sigma factor [Planctomycetaceae bacterium]